MEHKGVFTDGDKMLRGGAQRIKKLTRKGDSDKDVGVSIGNQSTPRDEQTVVGNRIPISFHSRVSSYTTRKLRTGDELFPGDICRPGKLAKRQKFIRRGINSDRFFSQSIWLVSRATCRSG
ncbi:hypothetical protein Tco_0982213 [Tanacetum coccineum]